MSDPEAIPAWIRLIEKRHYFYWTAFAFLVFMILLAMIRYPLTWGLMDDHQNLEWVRGEWRSKSLWQVLEDHSMNYWFRPVYPFFVYVAYGAFQNHPKIFYGVNLFFVMGCCLPWAGLLGRHLSKDFRRDGRFLYAFLLFAWTSMSTLILFLSLQEKFIILLGGTAFLCFDLLLIPTPRSRIPPWGLVAIGVAALSLALLTKPTALSLIPWLALSLAAAPGLPLPRKAAMLAVLLVPVGVMLVVFLRVSDPYSQRYWVDWGRKVVTLQIRVYAFMALGLGTGALLVFGQRREGSPFPQLVPALAWPITLLSYLALQIPWGLFSYNWTPAMVLASGCIALAMDVLLPRREPFRRAVMAGTLACSTALAAVITVQVTLPRLSEQSELSPLVLWLRTHVPDPTVDIYALPPLIEGTVALMSYTDRVQPITYLNHDVPVARRRPRTWLIASPGVSLSPLHARDFTRPVFRTAHWTIWERGPE
ncbi:MAG TPA: hypothetical protein VMU54_21065 [Planctomycetota bacterium]|nr:hypothetical protein [Planctomycetota bacterium]